MNEGAQPIVEVGFVSSFQFGEEIAYQRHHFTTIELVDIRYVVVVASRIIRVRDVEAKGVFQVFSFPFGFLDKFFVRPGTYALV